MITVFHCSEDEERLVDSDPLAEDEPVVTRNMKRYVVIVVFVFDIVVIVNLQFRFPTPVSYFEQPIITFPRGTP